LLKVDQITEYPEKLSKYFVSDLQIRPTDGSILLYIPKDKVSDSGQLGFVTRRQLKGISKELENKYDTPVNVILLKSRKIEALELGLIQMLNQRFDNAIEQFYLSYSAKSEINAWILVPSLSVPLKEEIYNLLKLLLKESSLKVGTIQWINSDNDLPSHPAILKMVKSIQPAMIECINENLKSNYPDTSEKWLNKQLDKLIKKKFLVRDKSSENYSLTSHGLSVVPNTLNRNSSDVIRALALGKRKWSN
jgi:hypothetical protein